MVAPIVTILLFLFLGYHCKAFFLPSPRQRVPFTQHFLADDPITDWDDTRKAKIFEVALRDLQIEGVPLLECDADQVHTLQAALWTTMAELTEQDDANKACLILDRIPVPALQAFVDDFLILKDQIDQMEHLPELNRLTASLVAKGLGPAILMEATPKSDDAITSPFSPQDEFKCLSAMKMFMSRVVVGDDGENPASVGLGDEGFADPIVYRSTFSTSVCTAMASFWNCICEMQLSSDAGTICLMMPCIASFSHDRFVAVSQLLSRSLCLYQGDAVFSLVHFHPDYDRAKVTPVDKPAFGHLPPLSWLLPMLKANQDEAAINVDSLGKTNYQRRAPIMAVNIVRNSLLADPKIVTIKLDSGIVDQASGLEVYCPNTLSLSATDERVLQEALDREKGVLAQV